MKTQQPQYPDTEEGRAAKAQANRAMFDGIAHRYDLLNRCMSLGLDRRWRRRLGDLCEIGPGSHCLDLCCGTGDVTRELAGRGASVVGLDASAKMLAIAAGRTEGDVSYVQGDALHLPFDDASFDAVTIAFGNRNVASLSVLFAEMRRVAKPGGRIVSLEINRPTSPLLYAAFFCYFSYLPALLARLLGADPAAYRYLPASVRQYPSPAEVAEIMRSTGLRDVCVEAHLGGIIVLHRGVG
ncbi:MAG TPA: ubiquinone/menaquinone biosynthesis methyltransferase [Armatimonadota bacterium]